MWFIKNCIKLVFIYKHFLKQDLLIWEGERVGGTEGEWEEKTESQAHSLLSPDLGLHLTTGDHDLSWKHELDT